MHPVKLPTPSRREHRYAKIRQVGSGTFGCCWLVSDTATGATLVMKEVSLRNLPAKEQKATRHEVNVLQAVKHPHCIAYMDSFICAATQRDDAKLCICMEWASGGDLAALISRRKRVGKLFTEPEVLRFTYQICDALSYCHRDLKLLHRDLKPANIFLSSTGQVKVGDFGISRFLSASEALAHTQCGTPLYMSPEMARGQSYSRAADAWAVGCIMYEMMTLTAPWIGQLGARAAEGGVPGLMRRISRDVLQTAGLHRHYSMSVVALLSALCAREPQNRPSLASVLDWPILRPYAPLRPADPLPRLNRQPPARHDDAAGVDQHAAAMAIQRSFKRSLPTRRNRVAAPRGGAEDAVDIADNGQVGDTLLIRDQPEDGIGKAAEAAGDYARQAARDAARRAMQDRIEQHQTPLPTPRPALLAPREGESRNRTDQQPLDKMKPPAEFVPASAFTGARDGCVFKRGRYGIGYYRDARRMQQLQRSKLPAHPLTAAAAGRDQPAPSSARPSPSPYVANAPPMARVPSSVGLRRVPSSARLPSKHPVSGALPAAGLARVPSSSRVVRAQPPAAAVPANLQRAPSAGALLQHNARADIQPMPSKCAADNGRAAAVAAAVAAKKALEAAAVARRAANELRAARDAGEDIILDAEDRETEHGLWVQVKGPEEAERNQRPAKVVAAAVAAQKIIDSFKRSQARRRGTLAPQARNTLNRRVSGAKPPSARARDVAAGGRDHAVPLKRHSGAAGAEPGPTRDRCASALYGCR